MPYFNIVAQTTENTVVTEYEPVRNRSDSYQSEAELEQEFGVKVFPIVTIWEVVSYLHNREIGGKVYIDDALYARVLEYQKIYGVNSGD